MRIRHLVVLIIVLAASTIVGQEEPLPRVIPAVQPVVALAVEPFVDTPAPTLADAARANDYAAFSALFEKTRNAAYAPLHELWTYSVNDPVGAFYGPEMYEKLARAYPTFAAYIDEYRIVDMRGNVFYPTSETRQFLLARAVEGVRIAEEIIESPRPVAVAERAPVAEEENARAIEPAPRYEATPETAPTPTPAPAPVPLPAPVAAAVVDEPAPAPVAIAAAPEPVAAVQPLPVPDRKSMAGRGLLLVIIGLIGVGLLALILKTPAGEPAAITPPRET